MKPLDTFVVWGNSVELIVRAETPVRAIQAAILANDGLALDYNAAPLDTYSDKAQSKILANARFI